MESFDMLWWHWLIVAGVLLMFEMFGASGFLLGFATAAFLVAGLDSVWVMQWELQVLLFASVGTALSFYYVKRFKNFNRETDRPILNDKLSQLIGKNGEVIAVDSATLVKIRLGDTLWSAQSNQPLNIGDRIVVDAVEDELVFVIKS